MSVAGYQIGAPSSCPHLKCLGGDPSRPWHLAAVEARVPKRAFTTRICLSFALVAFVFLGPTAQGCGKKLQRSPKQPARPSRESCESLPSKYNIALNLLTLFPRKHKKHE